MSEKYEKYLEGVDFQFFSPSPILKDCIKHYVVFCKPSHLISNQYFYPFPNSEIELYFHLNSSKVVIKKENRGKFHNHFLLGLFDLSNQFLIKLHTEDKYYQCIVISINICFINHIINIPLSRLKNNILDLSEIWGAKGTDLSELIYQENNISEIIKLIDNFLVEVFCEKIDKKSIRINKILKHCVEKEGQLTVDELASETRLSYRTIYRIFTQELDICPKDYLKVLRFCKVCKLLKVYPVIDWSELVYSCGYFDQAHFIHEFKSIMNVSPKEFLNRIKGKFNLMHPLHFES